MKCYTLEGDQVILVFRVHSDWLDLQKHVTDCRLTTGLTRTTAAAAAIVAPEFPQFIGAPASNHVNQLVAEQLQFYEAATIFHPLLVQNVGTLT